MSGYFSRQTATSQFCLIYPPQILCFSDPALSPHPSSFKVCFLEKLVLATNSHVPPAWLICAILSILYNKYTVAFSRVSKGWYRGQVFLIHSLSSSFPPKKKKNWNEKETDLENDFKHVKFPRKKILPEWKDVIFVTVSLETTIPARLSGTNLPPPNFEELFYPCF